MWLDPDLMAAFMQAGRQQQQQQQQQQNSGDSMYYTPEFAYDPANGFRNPPEVNPVAYSFVKPRYDVPDPSADFATSFGYDRGKTDVTLPGPPSGGR